MEDICQICEGSGLRIAQENGRQVARTCECRLARRTARRLNSAHIPRRYEHCTLETYETRMRGLDRSQQQAIDDRGIRSPVVAQLIQVLRGTAVDEVAEQVGQFVVLGPRP